MENNFLLAFAVQTLQDGVRSSGTVILPGESVMLDGGSPSGSASASAGVHSGGTNSSVKHKLVTLVDKVDVWLDSQES